MQNTKYLPFLAITLTMVGCVSQPTKVSYAVPGDASLNCFAITTQIDEQKVIEEETSATITEASLTDAGARAGGTAAALAGSRIPFLGNILQVNSSVQQSRIKVAQAKNNKAVGRRMHLESMAKNNGCGATK
ncbi:MAG: hypothetical protein GXP22_04915 [Gammaproteobacteria bacterium]|nr:hypothetical protein [Gammaproteobacteria bacterium]